MISEEIKSKFSAAKSFKVSDPKQALALFKEIINAITKPSDHSSLITYVYCLRQTENYSDAIDIIKDNFPKYPASFQLRSEYSWCLYYNNLKTLNLSYEKYVTYTNEILQYSTPNGNKSPYNIVIINLLDKIYHWGFINPNDFNSDTFYSMADPVEPPTEEKLTDTQSINSSNFSTKKIYYSTNKSYYDRYKTNDFNDIDLTKFSNNIFIRLTEEFSYWANKIVIDNLDDKPFIKKSNSIYDAETRIYRSLKEWYLIVVFRFYAHLGAKKEFWDIMKRSNYCFIANFSLKSPRHYLGKIEIIALLTILYERNLEQLLTLFLSKVGFKDQSATDKYIAAFLSNENDYSEEVKKTYGWQIYTETRFFTKEWVDKNIGLSKIAYLLKTLILERLAIKKISNKSSNNSVAVSALGEYVFCPASLSISKSFDVEKEKKLLIGTSMHKLGLLITKEKKNISSSFKKFYLDEEYDHTILQMIEKEIPEIKECILVFHDDGNNKEYFSGMNNKISGKPDYIFKHPDGSRILIEEKFSSNKESTKVFNTEFLNHKIQVLGYIYGLETLNIDYAYILNWIYEFEKETVNIPGISDSEDKIKIISCRAYKVDKSEEHRNLFYKKFTEVTSLINSQTIEFDVSKVNYNKCASCDKKIYCKHKTKEFSFLSYPYVY